MKRSMRALVAAMLVATPLVTSCADVPRDPTSLPAVSQPQNGLISGLLGGVLGLLGNILTGPDANGPDASGWIGSAGGTVSTASYTLVVPANAVSQSTLFEIEPANNGSYTTELHAYRKGLLGLVDVGSKGFNKPVVLKVSYANASGVVNPNSLVIIYINSQGVPEIQNSTTDATNKTVASSLSHFSKYALAQN